MHPTTNHFQATDGVPLFEQRWSPSQASKATLAIVHGYTEHSGRYHTFAQKASQVGVTVEACDLRGHGQSGGPRGFVHDFNHYINDVSQFLGRVQKRNPNQPLFLFGHSLGGTIATHLTAQNKTHLNGLILSGAALIISDSISPTMQCILTALSKIAPKFPTVPIGTGSVITQNNSAIENYDQDPLVYRGRVPARAGAEVLRAITQIQNKMASVRVPLLILHGTADRVTDPKGSQLLYERAQSPDKTFKKYEGLYHSLLEESQHDQVGQDILSWLIQRLSNTLTNNTPPITHPV